jgi:KipI family sensor histidine kinase inhibitor
MKPGVALPAVLSDILNEEQGRQAAAPGTKQHEIAVTFDGEDLRFVAAQTGLSVPDLIRRLCATVFSVKFLGFQPGFAYLEGLPEALHLARRNTPRTRVPAGSVALGGPYCGIYPAEGPGGWHLVGRTEAILFNPAARPPARLQPGDTVRLVPA